MVHTAYDMIMMGNFGAAERTEAQWQSLVARAGLRIEKIWSDPGEVESVIELLLDGGDCR